MAYEYEKENIGKVRYYNVNIGCGNESSKELREVYAKAKILNKIIDIVKTGRIIEDFVDAEVTLLAIEHELNYILEEK